MRALSSKSRQALITSLLAAVAALVVFGVSFFTMQASERLFLDDIRTRAQATLAVQTSTLERHLDKFRLLPALLAQRPDVRAMIASRDPTNGERVASIVAAMSGAQEVAFLDAAGQVLSSSAWPGAPLAPRLKQEFPTAFQEAMEGRLGRELLRGDANRAASYVFATAVRVRGRELGVVAVKVDLAAVEQAWALSKDPLVATDAADEIVVTNRPEWRGRKVRKLAGRAIAPQSGEVSLEGPIELRAKPSSGFDLVHIDDGARRLDVLRLSQPITVLGWRVATYSDITLARSQATKATIITVLVCLLLAGLGWVMLERRRQTMRRMREERAAAQKLEQRVLERTHDLSEANRKLAREIEEREATEEDLRQAQADLVQAAKLATLGRMSAALSHEFNQPLAAIRSNAENAQILLDRQMTDKASGNLGKIIAMVERMAEISRTLKGFTRRAGTETSPVRLVTAIDEAMMLLSPRVKQSDIRLTLEKPKDDPVVLAGQVRMEQVILNLASNALDAVSKLPGGHVRLSLFTREGNAYIEVADNGPGIPDDVAPQIFDPFFTTKEVGEGLGLGLSIAYKIIHDFSGSLSVSKAPEGGALFTVRLPLSDRLRAAAE